jgi:hypothetical protein
MRLALRCLIGPTPSAYAQGSGDRASSRRCVAANPHSDSPLQYPQRADTRSDPQPARHAVRKPHEAGHQ